MATAEWMAAYRERIKEEEPEKWATILKKARIASRKVAKAERQQKRARLASDPMALEKYLRQRRKALRGWQTRRLRQLRASTRW